MRWSGVDNIRCLSLFSCFSSSWLFMNVLVKWEICFNLPVWSRAIWRKICWYEVVWEQERFHVWKQPCGDKGTVIATSFNYFILSVLFLATSWDVLKLGHFMFDFMRWTKAIKTYFILSLQVQIIKGEWITYLQILITHNFWEKKNYIIFLFETHSFNYPRNALKGSSVK